MSATMTESTSAAGSTTTGLGRATFGGAVRSEWIKLRSLRSTVWCYAIIVLVTLGIGLLLSSVGGVGVEGEAPAPVVQSIAVQAVTAGGNFSALVAAVLGALVITGEWGTGMIRSTFTAIPSRTPALLAKALVFGGVTFLVVLGATLLTALVSAAVLPATGIDPDFTDMAYWWPIVGVAGYVTLVGLLAFALGAIIRNSAGAIAAALGLVLVLPTITQIFAAITQTAWVANLGEFLPSSAGARMVAYAGEGVETPTVVPGAIMLDPAQGTLVMLAWVAVPLLVAIVTVRRRDV